MAGARRCCWLQLLQAAAERGSPLRSLLRWELLPGEKKPSLICSAVCTASTKWRGRLQATSGFGFYASLRASRWLFVCTRILRAVSLAALGRRLILEIERPEREMSASCPFPVRYKRDRIYTQQQPLRLGRSSNCFSLCEFRPLETAPLTRDAAPRSCCSEATLRPWRRSLFSLGAA